MPVRAGSIPFRCAEPSPDGTLIVGALDQRQSDIYLVTVSSGALKAVTQDGAVEACPRWSPDGRMIAFESNAEGGRNLWIARTDGTILYRSRFPGGLAHPVWGPDSRSLAAVDLRRGGCDIYRVAPDGTLTHGEPLPPLAQSFIPVAWSPDGTQIAGTAGGAVRLYTLATRTFDRLIPGGHPTWLSNSRRLIFASEGRLILVDVPSGFTREILSVADLYLDDPTLSADDRQLYFTRNAPEANLWIATLR